MKYVDKLISIYKDKYDNGFERSFGDEESFETDKFYEDLYELSGVEDKVIFLKFIIHRLNSEMTIISFHLDRYEISVTDTEMKEINMKMIKNLIIELKAKKERILTLIEKFQNDLDQFMVLAKANSNNAAEIPSFNSINSVDKSMNIKLKPENTKRKIQWLQDETLIVYLYEMLYSKGCISKSDYDYFPEFIVKYFVNKKGEPFKLKNLNSSKSNLKDNVKNFEPRNAHKVKSIFENKD